MTEIDETTRKKIAEAFDAIGETDFDPIRKIHNSLEDLCMLAWIDEQQKTAETWCEDFLYQWQDGENTNGVRLFEVLKAKTNTNAEACAVVLAMLKAAIDCGDIKAVRYGYDAETGEVRMDIEDSTVLSAEDVMFDGFSEASDLSMDISYLTYGHLVKD